MSLPYRVRNFAFDSDVVKYAELADKGLTVLSAGSLHPHGQTSITDLFYTATPTDNPMCGLSI